MTGALYGPDLAEIQATAYGGHVEASRQGVLNRLRAGGIRTGRVVDLGCGAGDWLAHLDAAGYDAVGVEPSPDLCDHARRRAPGARVACARAEDADLTGARAVTALGEVFNYLPPAGRTLPLRALFRRIARALPSGGLLLFDLIVQGRPSLDRRLWAEGRDWLLAVDFQDGGDRGERRITVFREVDGGWRRSDECHRIRIPATARVLEDLRAAGFAAIVRGRWHEAPLLPRRRAFIARKR